MTAIRQRGIRLLSRSGLALSIGILVLFVVAFVLLGTGSGSRWALNRISAAMSTATSSLSIGRIEGTLLWGLNLQNLAYRQGTDQILIGSAQSNWNLLPLLSGRFTLESLRVDAVDIRWQTVSDPNQTPADPFAGIMPLPLAIQLNRVELSNIKLDIDDLALQLQSLNLAGTFTGETLDLTSLRTQLSLPESAGNLAKRIQEIHLDAALKLNLTPTLPLQGTLAWQILGPLSDTIDSASGLLEFDGDLQTLELTHQLQQPMALHSAGQLRLHSRLDAPAARPPELQLKHTLQQQTLPLPGLETLQLQNLQLDTYGQLNALRLDLSTSLSLPWLTSTQLTLQSQLDASRLNLSALKLSNSATTLELNGHLDWTQALLAEIDFTFNSALDSDESAQYLVALLPELPAGITLSNLSSAGQLQLRSEGGQTAGSFRLNQLNGQFNSNPISGNADIVFSNTLLSINALRLASAGNLLDIHGHIGIDTQPGQTVALNFNLQAPDLATLNPEARGSFHASGTITGTAETPQITLDSTAENIAWGNFRTDSFTATGSYANNSNQLAFSLLNAGLSTAAEQPLINALQGKLSGLPEAHEIELSIDSSYANLELTARGSFAELQWQGLIDRARIDSDYGNWGLQQALELSVSSGHFNVSRQCWQSTEGIPGQLCLQANWQRDDEFTVAASLLDYPLAVLNTPAAIERLGALDTVPQTYPQLQLPWYLPVSTTLNGTLGAEFNLNGAVNANPRDWDMNLAIRTGQNTLYLTPTPQQTETGSGDEPQNDNVIEQLSWSDASLTARQSGGEWQLLANLDFQQQNLDTGNTGMQGSLNVNAGMNREQQLSGQLALSVAELTFVEALVPQLRNVQGQLDGLVEIGGHLAQPEFIGELHLQQAAAQLPALGLSLTDIQATLTATDGNANSANAGIGTSGNPMTLTASASSGEGTLNLRSTLNDPLSEARQLNMTLQGSQFQLADLPELALQISPDLRITASSSGITVDGEIVLPQLDIVLDSLPESAVDVSGDTVLVGTPASGTVVRNAAQAERGAFADIPIHGDLQLTLGEEVHFSGFGLNTGLQGSLEINQRGTRTPLAYGELSIVNGSYVTYGQRLSIEHGKLLFFGSMDNPGLDIRAVRQTDKIKAGIQMNGTLRNLRSQLYSTPALPESDIIAVLVTGRPFSEIGTQQDGNALIGAITTLGINQGQSLTNQVRNQLGLDTLSISSRGDTTDSSLMLGKYITPAIFVRYAVGLFETESVLAIDYSISDRIKLEATSGQSQSIDMTYTLER
ncbi:MAG: translocation/assembly module TamB domain-containing protein [Pseudomonadales bacterium]|nr:translocation/assembly module TamB domain-containing protein [Pseudomonadales bacterium]